MGSSGAGAQEKGRVTVGEENVSLRSRLEKNAQTQKEKGTIRFGEKNAFNHEEETLRRKRFAKDKE